MKSASWPGAVEPPSWPGAVKPRKLNESPKSGLGPVKPANCEVQDQKAKCLEAKCLELEAKCLEFLLGEPIGVGQPQVFLDAVEVQDDDA